MPETAEEFYARAIANPVELPDVLSWQSFPFTGSDIQVRPLQPPMSEEPPRHGAGGVDCHSCDATDDAYIWTSEHWRISAPKKPTGLPILVFLNSRAHYSDPGDLPDDIAADFGIVLARLERAVRSVGEIGRVHFARWGDGGEHLHWWVYGRPARMGQLRGTFAALWDDVLPPTPDNIWQENVAQVARAMSGA